MNNDLIPSSAQDNPLIDTSIFNQLPIKEGERPLFATRAILENISRDITRTGNAYYSQSSANIIGFAAAIDTWTETFKSRCDANRRAHSQDLLAEWIKLPLFFNAKQVDYWETKRGWAAYCEQRHYISTAYGDMIDGDTPSDAYLYQTKETQYVWASWFEWAPINEIIDMMDFSRKQWLNWERLRKNQTMPIFHHILLLGHKMGLTNEECFSWTMFELISQPDTYKNLYTLARKELGTWQDVFSLWCKTLYLAPLAIEKLFYADAKLVKYCFYHSLEKINDPKKELESIRLFPYLHALLAKPLHDATTLLTFLAQPYLNPILPISCWDYLGHEIKNLLESLKSPQVSILIYGLKGSGKSSLAACLLDTIGKKGWMPYVDTMSKKSWTNHLEPSSSSALGKDDSYGLEQQFNMTSHLIADKNNALVFDGNTGFLQEAQHKKLITQFIHQHHTQIWVLEDIEKIDKDILSNFDMVIHLTELPFKNRISLAQHSFQDSDLAYRVAQAAKTPQEINKIAHWCKMSDDFSWKNAFYYMNSQHKLANHKNNTAPLLQPIECDHDLVDLAGNEEAHQLLYKLTDYFNHPQIYKNLGAKIPKGILLMGAPGTGKTHFAKHLMKNVGIPMFMVDTSKLVDNADNISLVFNEARQHAPCILFMDEIDVLINSPLEWQGVANLNKQKLLNSFLAQLDGINNADGILVIGATHQKIKPDPAAVRAGRLGEKVYLQLPNSLARKEIWKAHLKTRRLANDIDYDLLSRSSSNFSGAEIAEAINRAAILSAQKRNPTISIHFLLQACDDLFWGGADYSLIINEEEKYLTAIHEAGHALIAWKNGFHVNRITLRPRKGSLGAVNWENEEGAVSFNKTQLIQRIELALAGIASEKTIFGQYKNGGRGDLAQARETLRHILLQSGMGQAFKTSYSDMKDTGIWSERRKEALEDEEQTILDNAMSQCIDWLQEHQTLVKDFAQYLLLHKEVSGDQLNEWCQKVKYIKPTCMILPTTGTEKRVTHQQVE